MLADGWLEGFLVRPEMTGHMTVPCDITAGPQASRKSHDVNFSSLGPDRVSSQSLPGNTGC